MRLPHSKGLLKIQKQPLGLARLVSVSAEPREQKPLGGNASLTRIDVAIRLGKVLSFDCQTHHALRTTQTLTPDVRFHPKMDL
ncbi:MAG TPA: hypothetical protein VJ779_11955 [Acetobacteraceae bacterium]|nr:hypothetical protein [Acetobacteraceae bacterium]